MLKSFEKFFHDQVNCGKQKTYVFPSALRHDFLCLLPNRKKTRKKLLNDVHVHLKNKS